MYKSLDIFYFDWICAFREVYFEKCQKWISFFPCSILLSLQLSSLIRVNLQSCAWSEGSVSSESRVGRCERGHSPCSWMSRPKCRKSTASPVPAPREEVDPWQDAWWDSTGVETHLLPLLEPDPAEDCLVQKTIWGRAWKIEI